MRHSEKADKHPNQRVSDGRAGRWLTQI